MTLPTVTRTQTDKASRIMATGKVSNDGVCLMSRRKGFWNVTLMDQRIDLPINEAVLIPFAVISLVF